MRGRRHKPTVMVPSEDWIWVDAYATDPENNQEAGQIIAIAQGMMGYVHDHPSWDEPNWSIEQWVVVAKAGWDRMKQEGARE